MTHNNNNDDTVHVIEVRDDGVLMEYDLHRELFNDIVRSIRKHRPSSTQIIATLLLIATQEAFQTGNTGLLQELLCACLKHTREDFSGIGHA